jgi:hypothetical protein
MSACCRQGGRRCSVEFPSNFKAALGEGLFERGSKKFLTNSTVARDFRPPPDRLVAAHTRALIGVCRPRGAHDRGRPADQGAVSRPSVDVERARDPQMFAVLSVGDLVGALPGIRSVPVRRLHLRSPGWVHERSVRSRGRSFGARRPRRRHVHGGDAFRLGRRGFDVRRAQNQCAAPSAFT